MMTREDSIATLRGQVEGWLEGFGLRGSLAHAIETASAWTAICSPASASDEDRRLAALDLTLWLFAVDDDEGPLRAQALDRCVEQLHGRRPSGPAGREPVVAARERLLELIGARASSLDRYRRSRVRYVEAVGRRDGMRPDEPPPSFEDYLRLRETTIYVEQWIELWGALRSIDLQADRDRAPELRTATRAIVHWNIFDNEPRSLTRDRARGTPNLVDLWSRERGCEPTDGVGSVIQKM